MSDSSLEKEDILEDARIVYRAEISYHGRMTHISIDDSIDVSIMGIYRWMDGSHDTVS